MNPITRLEHLLPKLTNKEASIAEYILEDPTVIVRFSADKIVKAANSSKSAFIRMCQKLGYAGYAEFRFSCSSYIFSNTEKLEEESVDPIHNIVSNYATHLFQMVETLDRDKLSEISDIILNARTIKTYGLNRTSLPPKQLQMRGVKMGLDFDAVPDFVVLGDLGPILTTDDVCLYFSIHIDSKIHRDLVKTMKASDCTTILFTMSTTSPLLKDFDHVLTLPSMLNTGSLTFLDNQAIFFVFVEILLNDLARKMNR